MKKGIIRDFVEVLFFFGADYKQRFKKQFLGKIFTVIAMTVLTAIFAFMAAHYGVFKIGLNDEIDWQTALIIFGGLLFVFLLAYGIAAVFTGGVIVIPIMCLLAYIDKNYGKKQHIINVFLFALCAAFALFTTNLVHIFEHLCGVNYHNMANNLGHNLEAMFAMMVVFATVGIFGWLSGISKAWTYAVKEMVAIEEAIAQRKHPKKNKK